MANKIFDQLSRELAKAKDERPSLEKDDKQSETKMIDESTGNTPRPLFFHTSHNSHGDWGKHWAHGGFEEDEPQDNIQPSLNITSSR